MLSSSVLEDNASRQAGRQAGRQGRRVPGRQAGRQPSIAVESEAERHAWGQEGQWGHSSQADTQAGRFRARQRNSGRYR
jgi:hypothetical protein